MSKPLTTLPAGVASSADALVLAINDRIRRINQLSTAPAQKAAPTVITVTTPAASATSLKGRFVTTTPYVVDGVNDDVLTFMPGSSVVTLPALTTGMRRRVFYLINASGGTLALHPAAGDTVDGVSTSFPLYNGGRYELMPNA